MSLPLKASKQMATTEISKETQLTEVEVELFFFFFFSVCCHGHGVEAQEGNRK